MNIGEAFRFSLHALAANRVRSLLTALGMVIGNASVILVVTISLTSRDYVLEQIRGVGSNMIYAYCTNAGQAGAEVAEDFVKLADIEAVRAQLGSQIVAATGVMTQYDDMIIGGRQERLQIIGSDEYYHSVRNLVLLSGRFLDYSDVALRQRVALLTEKLARRLYGTPQASLGQILKVHGTQVTVIGTFKERVSSFGLSELSGDTILIPVTLIRYFTPVERVDPMYVQARRTEDVPSLTLEVQRILESRHRASARYTVENLAAILDAAASIALIMTLVLILISAIALIISGIGIMNIMLVTVTERTREIGIRMAVGASRREVLQQFLLEAVLLSLSGGVVGILLGVALPLSVQYFAEGMRIPISITSIVVAFAVSCLVGLVFGLLPANRASRLNPTEALRYE
jgi:putative ABC transport system permease protein